MGSGQIDQQREDIKGRLANEYGHVGCFCVHKLQLFDDSPFLVGNRWGKDVKKAGVIISHG